MPELVEKRWIVEVAGEARWAAVRAAEDWSSEATATIVGQTSPGVYRPLDGRGRVEKRAEAVDDCIERRCAQ